MNLDGGVHRIPLVGPNAANVAGSLWLCGKHAIAPDPAALFSRIGLDDRSVDVICLVEEHEIGDRYPDYVDWLRASSTARWFPILDLSSPPMTVATELYDDVWSRLVRGRHVVAHCGAGMGRAGTLGVVMCLYAGLPVDEALDHVRRHRPGAGPEVGSQMESIESLAERSTTGVPGV